MTLSLPIRYVLYILKYCIYIFVALKYMCLSGLIITKRLVYRLCILIRLNVYTYFYNSYLTNPLHLKVILGTLYNMIHVLFAGFLCSIIIIHSLVTVFYYLFEYINLAAYW